MDVTPWFESLERLTAPDGWIGADPKDEVVQNVARRARNTLVDYAAKKNFLGHRFKCDQSTGATEAAARQARKAGARRDAVLALAVAHELLQRADRLGQDGESLYGLGAQVALAALDAPTGVRPHAADDVGDSAGYETVDFAHSQHAQQFFEGRIAARLQTCDGTFGTFLSAFAGATYDRASEASIERWGKAWTAAAALLVLDWARIKCTSYRELARAIWRGGSVRVKGPVLPTSFKRLHYDLVTSPELAQVFGGSDELWGAPPEARIRIHVRSHALSSATEGIDTIYTGRVSRHPYLLLFADCLRNANRRLPAAGQR